jgi:hypothetical protein
MLLLCAISDTTATTRYCEVTHKLVIFCAMFLLLPPILCKVYTGENWDPADYSVKAEHEQSWLPFRIQMHWTKFWRIR